MNRASLSQWLERLETLHPSEMELGLERVSVVAHRLQLLPVTVPVITISGTNGKGSTSAVLEALLGELGRTTGVCSSPHFLKFNERIRVSGSEVDDELIVEAFEQIDEARGEVSLTYFEFATLAALVVFRRLKVEVMVLEVGLGGRLDAVNIVDADIAVITSIALDHQEWLGDTRELIAVEKAGVLRPGRPAVIAEPDPPESLRDLVRQWGVEACFLGEDFQVDNDEEGWRAILRGPDGGVLPLAARRHGALLPANICAALQALVLLGESFSESQITDALAEIRLPGRRETQFVGQRQYLLDVAHNPAAVNKLLEYIDLTPCKGKTIALFSVMADKDVEAMMRACKGFFDAWFLADQPGISRAMAAADIAVFLRNDGHQMISMSKNIRQAFRRAQTLLGPDDRLVVFGSFFTVAGVLPLLDKDRRKEVQ